MESYLFIESQYLNKIYLILCSLVSSGSLGGGKSVRRRGNVHTLSDGNDSNDENNTWNGNSTQLM